MDIQFAHIYIPEKMFGKNCCYVLALLHKPKLVENTNNRTSFNKEASV
jgi:hypothetical protein